MTHPLSRRGWLFVVLLLSGRGIAAGQHQEIAAQYAETLRVSLPFWLKQGAVEMMSCNHQNGLTTKLLIQANENRVEVYTQDEGFDSLFVFHEKGIRAADNITEMIDDLPPIRAADDAGTTCHPTEIPAVRILALITTLPLLGELLGDASKRQLTPAEEKQVFEAIYPEVQADSGSYVGLHWLVVNKNKELLEYRLRPLLGTVCSFRLSPVSAEQIAEKRKSYDWVSSDRTLVPMPPLKELLDVLKPLGVTMKEADTSIQGKGGVLALKPADVKRDEVLLETARIRLGDGNGRLATAIGIDGLSVSKRLGKIDDRDGKSIGIVGAYAQEKGNACFLALRGQNWRVSISFLNSEPEHDALENRIIEELKTYLKKKWEDAPSKAVPK